MRRTYRTLNDCEMQHNAEVGLFTRPSTFIEQLFPRNVIGGVALYFHLLDILERGGWKKKNAAMYLNAVVLLNTTNSKCQISKTPVHWQAV